MDSAQAIKRLLAAAAALLCVATARAGITCGAGPDGEQTIAVFNAITGRWDCITQTNVNTIIGGSGATVSYNAATGVYTINATGGGGAAALAIALGTTAGFTTLISSPTGAGVFDQAMFTGQLTGSATSFLTIRYAVTNVTSNYTVTSTDSFITADATSASLTVTLPTAVGIKGRIFTVKRLSSGSNTVTIGTTSAQTIDGATTQVLTIQYTSVDIISDGSNWEIL